MFSITPLYQIKFIIQLLINAIPSAPALMKTLIPFKISLSFLLISLTCMSQAQSKLSSTVSPSVKGISGTEGSIDTSSDAYSTGNIIIKSTTEILSISASPDLETKDISSDASASNLQPIIHDSHTTGNIEDNVLAISYFNATKRIGDKTVDLSWATLSESENDFFILEQSANGNDWEEIDVISGAGTSSELRRYMINDLSPTPGYSMYRLIKTDFEGQIELSPIRVVEIDETENNTNQNLQSSITTTSVNGDVVVKSRTPHSESNTFDLSKRPKSLSNTDTSKDGKTSLRKLMVN